MTRDAEIAALKAELEASVQNARGLWIDAEQLASENKALRAVIERWKLEEVRQTVCQCTDGKPGILGAIEWCYGCERPLHFKDVKPNSKAEAAMLTLLQESAP